MSGIVLAFPMTLKGKRAPAKQNFLNDLIDTALAIKDQPATKEDAAYMAKHLVQCTLPHKDPGQVMVWKRKNGNLTLKIRPATDEQDRAMYPYGSIPRLLLFWMVSEVTRSKNVGSPSRRIDLGTNLDEFMRQIGLSPRTGGGKRGDAHRLRNQMERLFRSTISFEVAGGRSWVDMNIAPKGEFWWKSAEPEQGKLWVSWIELGEEFYKAILESTIPVDFRALKALKRSPLALDLYALLAYKTDAANRKDAKGDDLAPVPWEGLHNQMGAEYKELRRFKQSVASAVKKILAVSQMKAELTDYGIKVHPGKTPIASTPKKEKVLEGK
jgi:hypothetical protein